MNATPILTASTPHCKRKSTRLGGASFEDLITDDARNHTEPGRGGKRPRREGTIVAIRDKVLIEFDFKLQGVCPVDH